MLAGVAAGVFADLGEACAAMVVPNRRFEPVPSTRAAYEAGYQRYLELFEALRPSFATLGPGHG
jgi:sugar (pentulose or hexulose) kinase